MRRLRRVALTITLIAVTIYIAVLAGLYFRQRDLIYPGAGGKPGLVASEVGFDEVMLTTEDGLKLRALYRAPRVGMPTILMFHGNGEGVFESVAALRPLIPDGYGMLLSEYRGFGGNPGQPSEQGLYRDARAAWGWLRGKGVAAHDIVILGYSLGTGVAAQLAFEHAPRALILVAAYTDIPHVTRQHYPWIPAGLLVTERFRTIDKLPRIACPVLLLHGRNDDTIPASNSVALAKARPDAKLELVAGTGHGIIYRDDTMRRIDRWLRTRSVTMDRQPELTGELLALRPAVREDFDALFAVARDPLIWEIHPAHDRWRAPVFQRFFDDGLASGGMLVARDRATDMVVGSSRYDFARAEPGEVEIGWTFLARSHWGGRYNAEMKALMLDHAFHSVDRVLFMVGEANIRSRRAVEKIGGYLTQRQHLAKMAGRSINHVVYAIDRPADADSDMASSRGSARA